MFRILGLSSLLTDIIGIEENSRWQAPYVSLVSYLRGGGGCIILGGSVPSLRISISCYICPMVCLSSGPVYCYIQTPIYFLVLVLWMYHNLFSISMPRAISITYERKRERERRNERMKRTAHIFSQPSCHISVFYPSIFGLWKWCGATDSVISHPRIG